MASTRELSARDVAADRIKEWRRRRAMTGEDLAARCAELGAPHLTRPIIASIETRRRGVSVDDLLALALALDVPPVLLLALPDDGHDALAITTAVHIADPEVLRGWLVGEAAPPESNTRLYFGAALERMAAPGGEAMPAYAKAVVQETAARIASQYEAEATALLERTRGQILEILSQVAAEVAGDSPREEILHRLDEIRQRVSRRSGT
jgi:transcriptional regulator with XRE-family HTH domain